MQYGVAVHCSALLEYVAVRCCGMLTQYSVAVRSGSMLLKYLAIMCCSTLLMLLQYVVAVRCSALLQYVVEVC